MPDKKQARVRVQLTVEIAVDDRWGGDCSVQQVFEQGADAAMGMIENWKSRDPHVARRVTIIGKPRVQAVFKDEME